MYQTQHTIHFILSVMVTREMRKCLESFLMVRLSEHLFMLVAV